MKFLLRHKRSLLMPALLLAGLLLFYVSQRFWAHRTDRFIPDDPRIPLTEASDYETIFLQTGLGPSAVDKLLYADDFDTILTAQELFFDPPQVRCTPLLGWFTREDRLSGGTGIPLVDLQPGDILISLSTHTAGWRHGHAALVISKDTALESTVWGSPSALVDLSHWNTYSCYVQLRPKRVSPELQQQVADYAVGHLLGVPYRLSAGFLGPKAPEPEDWQFGLHCSYLAWYAWNQYGIDLDSDGGRLVTSADLLFSDRLEVVQMFGMDPKLFSSRIGSK